jgi:hypothetical protein
MKKKLVGYLKLYRWVALKFKKDLTDQEYRLLDIYACLARWDPRDKERFSFVELSTEDIRNEYLSWSKTKFSEVKNSLIKKGFLVRHPKHIINVNNFEIYQAKIRQAEQIFRCMEQGIQPTEQQIQQNEQKDREKMQIEKQNLIDKYRVIGL